MYDKIIEMITIFFSKTLFKSISLVSFNEIIQESSIEIIINSRT